MDGSATDWPVLETARLRLIPVTLAIVEATLADDLDVVASLIGAKLPDPWPGRALIEQAFSASLTRIREAPHTRLWGDRIAISKMQPARVVGSVIFHGRPDARGVVEVGYGIAREAQGEGYATEATGAQVEWALSDPHVREVRATTPPWHTASRRVLEKIGFTCQGTEEHDALGEVLLFIRRSA
jgi:RimJ/RimL family protein N-acetyltransferase